MNKRENNKVSMYQAVDAVFNTHKESINSFEPLADAVNRYRGAIADILQRDRVHTDTTIGVTAAKRKTEADMIDKVMFVGNGLNALGVKTGNEPLKAETGATRSDLYHARDNDLLQYGRKIHELAKGYADELTPYGITAEVIENLNAATAQVQAAIEAQTRKMAEGKSARSLLTEGFTTADAILKTEIDTLIELVKVKDVELYNLYQAVRVIKDHGVVHHHKDPASPEAAVPAQEVLENAV